MNNRPTRATTDGRAYLDLQNLARRTARPTDELHQLYALEGFLARLAGSEYKQHLVLKGGVLLAAYDTRRPTRDIDLQGQRLPNDTEHVLGVVCRVAEIDLDDGLSFDTTTAAAETIRDEDDYTGVRVRLAGRLSTAQLSLHIDVSVGDPIWPAPTTVTLPRLLEGQITLIGYPLPMVLAEKLVTALQRGTANTRWRDYADIYLLAGRHDLDGQELRNSIEAVAEYRRVRLRPLAEATDGYAALAQPRWAAWRRKSRIEDRLPADFSETLLAATELFDRILLPDSREQKWDAATRSWETR